MVFFVNRLVSLVRDCDQSSGIPTSGNRTRQKSLRNLDQVCRLASRLPYNVVEVQNAFLGCDFDHWHPGRVVIASRAIVAGALGGYNSPLVRLNPDDLVCFGRDK